MISTNHIATILKQLRSCHELTQEQVAQNLHISRKTLSSYETGRLIPPVVELKKLAIYYKVPADFLFSLISEESPSPKSPYSIKDISTSYEHFAKSNNISVRLQHLNEGERLWIHLFHSIPPHKRFAIILILFSIINDNYSD